MRARSVGPGFAAALLVLLSRTAAAYLSSAPDAAPSEVTTLQELEGYYSGKPGLAEEWARIQAMLRPPRHRRALSSSPLVRSRDGARDPGEADPAPLEELGGESAAGQLSEAVGGAIPEAPSTGPASRRDVPKTPCREPAADEPAEIKTICQIAREKSADGAMQQLYQQYLAKVYFGHSRFNGPLIGAQVRYIRDGIRNRDWRDFPTASFGEVPAGAAATWKGVDFRGGGHITMAPGLTNMRIFDHEWLHHSDAGHADDTPIGVNELNSIEPPCYKYMGCAAGMGGSGC